VAAVWLLPGTETATAIFRFSKKRKFKPEDVLPQKKSRMKLSIIRHDRRCGTIERLQFVAVSILPDSNTRGRCLFLRA
jgi:hypothetical protein